MSTVRIHIEVEDPEGYGIGRFEADVRREVPKSLLALGGRIISQSYMVGLHFSGSPTEILLPIALAEKAKRARELSGKSKG